MVTPIPNCLDVSVGANWFQASSAYPCLQIRKGILPRVLSVGTARNTDSSCRSLGHHQCVRLIFRGAIWEKIPGIWRIIYNTGYALQGVGFEGLTERQHKGKEFQMNTIYSYIYVISRESSPAMGDPISELNHAKRNTRKQNCLTPQFLIMIKEQTIISRLKNIMDMHI